MEEICPNCGSASVRPMGDTWDCMNCDVCFNPDHAEVRLAIVGKMLQIVSWYLDEPNPVTIKRVRKLLNDAIALATEE